jgi:hypothetical protein
MVACRVPGLAPSGQQVDIQRGAKTAGAALRFICPGAKRLVTFGTTGFFAPQDYGDHRSTSVMNFPPPRARQSTGTVYAVCR